MDNTSAFKEMAAMAEQIGLEKTKAMLKEIHMWMVVGEQRNITHEAIRQIAYQAIDEAMVPSDEFDMEAAGYVKAEITSIDMAELFPHIS